MIEDVPVTPQNIKKAIAISKLSPVYRTNEENKFYMSVLSNFGFFEKKVDKDNYEETLQAAASYLKYLRVPVGKFLYHLDRSCDYIYFILSGEAWEFREKTRYEVETDQAKMNYKKEATTSRFVETVELAKKLKDRKQALTKNGRHKPTVTTPTIVVKPVVLSQNEAAKNQQKTKMAEGSSLVYIKEGSLLVNNVQLQKKTSEKKFLSPNAVNEDQSLFLNLDEKDSNKIKLSLFDKIKQKQSIITFENEYFYGIIKRNAELSAKYIDNGLVLMKFYEKYDAFKMIGETTVNVAYTPPGAVLAYTSLDVLVLDQAGFAKVFSSQTTGSRQKFRFFQDIYPDVPYEELKKLCSLFIEHKFKVNEVIYNEDAPCDFLYFIRTGEVQLLKLVETKKSLLFEAEQRKSNKKGLRPDSPKSLKPILIANISNNQFFGEEVLFEHPLRGLSAKCVSSTVCYKLSLDVLKMVPEVIIKELHRVSQSKRTWRNERIETIVGKFPKEVNEMTLDEFKQLVKAPKPMVKQQVQKLSLPKEIFGNEKYQAILEKDIDENDQESLSDIEEAGSAPKSALSGMYQASLSKLLRKNDLIHNLSENSPSRKNNRSLNEFKEVSQSLKSTDFKTIFSFKPSEITVSTPKVNKQVSEDYFSDYLNQYGAEQNISNHSGSPRDNNIQLSELSATKKASQIAASYNKKSLRPFSNFGTLDRSANNLVIHSDRELRLKKSANRTLTEQCIPNRLVEENQRQSLLVSPRKARRVTTLKDDLIQSFKDRTREKSHLNSGVENQQSLISTKVLPQTPALFAHLIKNISYLSPTLNKSSLSTDTRELRYWNKDKIRDRSLGYLESAGSEKYSDINVRSFLRAECEPLETLSALTRSEVKKRMRIPKLRVATTKK